jgi:hypothetical protein
MGRFINTQKLNFHSIHAIFLYASVSPCSSCLSFWRLLSPRDVMGERNDHEGKIHFISQIHKNPVQWRGSISRFPTGRAAALVQGPVLQLASAVAVVCLFAYRALVHVICCAVTVMASVFAPAFVGRLLSRF